MAFMVSGGYSVHQRTCRRAHAANCWNCARASSLLLLLPLRLLLLVSSDQLLRASRQLLELLDPLRLVLVPSPPGRRAAAAR